MAGRSLYNRFSEALGQRAASEAVRAPVTRRVAARIAAFWLGGAGLVAGLVFLLASHSPSWIVVGMMALILGGCVTAAMVFTRIGESGKWSTDEPTALPAKGDPHLLAVVHDVLGDITVTRSMDRHILTANETFRRLTQCRNPVGLTCEEIGIAFRPAGEPHRYHVEISTPDGQRIFIWHDVVTRDGEGGHLLLQSIARDVTAERTAIQALEEARHKAEYNSAAKSRLLATVSHELRTPLSGILGMTHLLAQTRLTQEQESYLGRIRQSGYALTQLVEDLLDFSTIEVGRFHLHTSLESPRVLLESVLEMLAHRAHEKNIEIGATFAPDVPETVNFDAARFRQVLFNVIGNAVKFTKEGGVFVRVGIDDGQALLVDVVDSGPGMTPEEQNRVFGEYEQAGSSAANQAGTGLGLSISARIVKQFGGSLTVRSEKGKGSTFTIRFPVAASPVSAKPAPRQAMLASSRVVILAPQGPAAEAICETVMTLGGTCIRVGDGAEALGILQGMAGTGTPATDLIVDHRRSGDFAAHLSGYGQKQRLRKIFLVNPEDRNAYSPNLFNAWLIRPLREQSLVDVLKGRMHGVEQRDILAEKSPGLALVPAHDDLQEGLDIVIGEDDPINAMLVRAVLEKAGHNVRHVEDFEALLDAALAQDDAARPHIIITDLSMPGGEGKEVLARLRAHERRLSLASLPVVVLTADSHEETRRQALLNGANRVMVKPVDPIRLLTEVQAVAAVSMPRAQAR